MSDAPRTLAASIGFTEGPLWTAAGELLVTSVSRGLVYRVPLDGSEPTVAFEPGGSPTGLALVPGGLICVAQTGSANFRSKSHRLEEPGIQIVRAGGVEQTPIRGCAAPNDLVFGPDGLLWFMDPGAPDPCVRTLDLSTMELETVLRGIDFPNGLAFGRDPEELYVADSASGDIIRFRRVQGRMGDARVHARMPGASPDGVAFDRDGNLYVAGFESDEVVVFDPAGTRVAVFATGERSRPTNVCFAGEGLSTLVVTVASGGRVLAVPGVFRGRAPSPGLEDVKPP